MHFLDFPTSEWLSWNELDLVNSSYSICFALGLNLHSHSMIILMRLACKIYICNRVKNKYFTYSGPTCNCKGGVPVSIQCYAKGHGVCIEPILKDKGIRIVWWKTIGSLIETQLIYNNYCYVGNCNKRTNNWLFQGGTAPFTVIIYMCIAQQLVLGCLVVLDN